MFSSHLHFTFVNCPFLYFANFFTELLIFLKNYFVAAFYILESLALGLCDMIENFFSQFIMF